MKPTTSETTEAKAKDELTEELVADILSGFSPEERQVIQEQRAALTKHGVTREPLRTKMACEFAEVILAGRKR